MFGSEEEEGVAEDGTVGAEGGKMEGGGGMLVKTPIVVVVQWKM